MDVYSRLYSDRYINCRVRHPKGEHNDRQNLKLNRDEAYAGAWPAIGCLRHLFRSAAVATGSAVAATTPPVLWTAGGLSAGNDGAGQAARLAVDASGNVAVVSSQL